MFTGPMPFYGSVASLAKIPAQDMQPAPVSGFGMVMRLSQTGSSEVPIHLRPQLMKLLRVGGFGSARLHLSQLPPDLVLDDLSTAAVVVEGLVPPGAPKGSRFDILVRALDGTQTTSLEGGQLYPKIDLSLLGTASGVFTHKQAVAIGDLYINPFEDEVEREQRMALSREAVVLSGGIVTRDRQIRLLLNQPHWTRCRMIANRVNERFRRERGESHETAVALDDSRIELNVPRRWRAQPLRLLELVLHLYVQRETGFELEKARELRKLALEEPVYARRVSLAWEALGRQALPVIREVYDQGDFEIRFAALSSGVRLGDERATMHLERLARHDDVAVRSRTAQLLVHLPQSVRAERILRDLLNDEQREVRIAAYHALDETGNDVFIRRQVFKNLDGKTRYVLDVVDSQRPMIYITQTRLPRIVIFNGFTGFKAPALSTIWKERNELIVRVTDEKTPMSVYYQSPKADTAGKVVEIAPAVANLVVLLAREPKPEYQQEGFGLDYSRVVNALFQLCHRDVISAELELQPSQLAQLLADVRREQEQAGEERPEVGEPEAVEEPGAPGEPGDPDRVARSSDS